MYESFFQFSQRPFAAAPTAAAFFPAAASEQARLTLIRCIERAEGPATLIGPAGTGKSLLLQVLARHLESRFQIAMLSSARLGTRRALLQNILFALRLPYRDMDEGELRLSLVDHLAPRDDSAPSEGMLLLIDEAHALPLRLLEEVRLITNIVHAGQSRVRLVLAGNSQLEERLANPKLESFHQRIAARCYLQSLTRDETIGYVQQQIIQAGGVAESVFTRDALKALHTATDGIPRLLNQVCDHALMLAAAGGQRQLGPDGIAEAWADLQQLPAPWHDSPPRSAGGTPSTMPQNDNVLEFGSLDDEAAVFELGELPPHRDAATEAELQLDEIDEELNWLTQGEQVGDFNPCTEEQTEVELIFHDAHDPFGSGWAEEEVVIDRYAQLEAATPLRRPRVASAEGRQIGQALSALTLNIASQDERAAQHPDPEAAPHSQDSRGAEAHGTRARLQALSLGLGDDRDIMIVAEPAEVRPAQPTGRVRRQEYRQLFSNLRSR